MFHIHDSTLTKQSRGSHGSVIYGVWMYSTWTVLDLKLSLLLDLKPYRYLSLLIINIYIYVSQLHYHRRALLSASLFPILQGVGFTLECPPWYWIISQMSLPINRKKLKVFCIELSHLSFLLLSDLKGPALLGKPCMTQEFFLISVDMAYWPSLLFRGQMVFLTGEECFSSQ